MFYFRKHLFLIHKLSQTLSFDTIEILKKTETDGKSKINWKFDHSSYLISVKNFSAFQTMWIQERPKISSKSWSRLTTIVLNMASILSKLAKKVLPKHLELHVCRLWYSSETICQVCMKVCFDRFFEPLEENSKSGHFRFLFLFFSPLKAQKVSKIFMRKRGLGVRELLLSLVIHTLTNWLRFGTKCFHGKVWSPSRRSSLDDIYG